MLSRIFLIAVTVLTSTISADADDLLFESDIRPILKTHCFHCHGEAGHVEGGLDLRMRRLMVEGGDSGAAIEAGDADASYLLQRMVDGDMPPEEVVIRPTAEEIETIRRWIGDGALTARPEPESVEDLPRITPEDRGHWAFRAIDRRTVENNVGPNPIDHFISQKLHDTGVDFSPRADRITLLRRAYYDLHGLPPTPELVERFLRQDSDDAWSNLIDGLLASPRYGERWGRHWLDVVGYADSEGVTDADPVRPYSHKYRDYVIDAFNRDLPFDSFIVEQLAGDELITSPLDELSDNDKRLLIATGYLRMAPDGTGGNPDDPVAERNNVIAETIKVVSTSLMGMTVGCAQCHDHRYDPILHDDYYRMRAVFAPAMNWQDWKTPSQRRIPVVSPEDKAENERIEKLAQEAEAKKRELQDEAIELVFQRELAKLPEGLRVEAKAAYHAEVSERTEAQTQLLVDYPNLTVSRQALGLYLELFDEGIKAKKAIEEQGKAVSELRAKAPGIDYIRTLTEFEAEVPQTFVFHRGDPSQPKQEVQPGSLQVLDHLVPVDLTNQLKDRGKNSKTTGRRLAFARHLTHADHPLTARVLVNRFWMHHMGRGLVSTPGDFGRQGQQPTHPELLDWLARDFIDSGWKLKRLHKLIMTSRTYQQSSRRVDPAFDPDNQWYSRMSVRRLEAEVVRDSILAVCGQLTYEDASGVVPVKVTEEGDTVVGTDIDPDAMSRRSVYVQSRRTTPLGMLNVFDAPQLEPNCTVRTVSTVATQSLMLMNSEVVVKQAEALADRLIDECGNDETKLIDSLWVRLFARKPSESEADRVTEFLFAQKEHLTEGDDTGQFENEATHQAVASLCHTMMGSNLFLYVD